MGVITHRDSRAIPHRRGVFCVFPFVVIITFYICFCNYEGGGIRAECVAMHESPDRIPTAALLHRVVRESYRYWAERSRNAEQMHAIVRRVRELLLRLNQKQCAFANDRLCPSICSEDERLENIGCPYVEADEREGPEILSAAGFALQKLGVIREEERVQIATVVMTSRTALLSLDDAVHCGRCERPIFQEGQDVVMKRKELARRDILQRIAEFLGERA